jgi:peroxin-10
LRIGAEKNGHQLETQLKPFMKFIFSDVAAILVAAEKDLLYIEELSECLRRSVFYFVEPQFALNVMPALHKTSYLLYYALTWLSNSKTMGEEHSLILPVDVHTRSTPSYFLRALYVLFSAITAYRTNRYIKSVVLPLHLIIFYSNAEYFDPMKRILGIRYVQPIKKRRMRTVHLVLVLCALLNALLDLRAFILSDKIVDVEKAAVSPDKIDQCPLCLGPRRYPSVTPCGHVYCWECISEWLTRFPQCPLCRGACDFSEVYTVDL